MTGVVNLNRCRKEKKAVAKEAEASGNRAKYGRTKAEKARDKRAADELAHHVEGHKREESE